MDRKGEMISKEGCLPWRAARKMAEYPQTAKNRIKFSTRRM